jgi:hypothetical protein
LVPRFWSCFDSGRAELEAIYPKYFAHFDADPAASAAQSDPAEYGRLFIQYLHGFKSKCRPELLMRRQPHQAAILIILLCFSIIFEALQVP